MSKILNCSFCCIRNRLQKYKIPIRTNTEAHLGKSLNHKIDCKCCFCRAKRGELRGIKLWDNVTEHPRYIDGRSLKSYYCIDCHKEITYQAVRCKICAKIGKNNPSSIYKGTQHWN